MLKEANRRFKSMLTGGKIRLSGPLEEEIKNREHLSLPRIAMKFNNRDYGKLFELINFINDSGETAG